MNVGKDSEENEERIIANRRKGDTCYIIAKKWLNRILQLYRKQNL